MVKFEFDLAKSIVILCWVGIAIHVYTAIRYYTGASDEWLSDLGVALTVVAFALALGVRDET